MLPGTPAAKVARHGYRVKFSATVSPRNHRRAMELAAALGCPLSQVVDLALGVLDVVVSRPDDEEMLTAAEYARRYLDDNCVLGTVDDNPLFRDYQAPNQG